MTPGGVGVAGFFPAPDRRPVPPVTGRHDGLAADRRHRQPGGRCHTKEATMTPSVGARARCSLHSPCRTEKRPHMPLISPVIERSLRRHRKDRPVCVLQPASPRGRAGRVEGSRPSFPGRFAECAACSQPDAHCPRLNVARFVRASLFPFDQTTSPNLFTHGSESG